MNGGLGPAIRAQVIALLYTVANVTPEPDSDDEPKPATLSDCVKAGDRDGVEKLITDGWDPDCREEGGATPLILACIYNRPACIYPLLVAGAEVDAKTEWGKTAREYAVAQRFPECVQELDDWQPLQANRTWWWKATRCATTWRLKAMQQIKQFAKTCGELLCSLHVLAPPVIVAVGAIALASGVHILLPPAPFGVLSLVIRCAVGLTSVGLLSVSLLGFTNFEIARGARELRGGIRERDPTAIIFVVYHHGMQLIACIVDMRDVLLLSGVTHLLLVIWVDHDLVNIIWPFYWFTSLLILVSDSGDRIAWPWHHAGGGVFYSSGIVMVLLAIISIYASLSAAWKKQVNLWQVVPWIVAKGPHPNTQWFGPGTGGDMTKWDGFWIMYFIGQNIVLAYACLTGRSGALLMVGVQWIVVALILADPHGWTWHQYRAVFAGSASDEGKVLFKFRALFLGVLLVSVGLM